ncbi:hypothetical protein F5Y10DRAFT_267703 [Nemania abortiva]|nr:hypothetical protein F5Y10DRAFT_267703 [Nemania abortiva]
MASLDGLPTEAPPPGVAPNLVDSESQAPPFVVLGIFVSLSLLAVLVRIFVRFRFTKGWGWDDCRIVGLCNSIQYRFDPKTMIQMAKSNKLWIAARNAAVNHIWDNITPSSLSGVISAQVRTASI